MIQEVEHKYANTKFIDVLLNPKLHERPWIKSFIKILDTKKEESIFGIEGNGNGKLDKEEYAGIDKLEAAADKMNPTLEPNGFFNNFEIRSVLMAAAKKASEQPAPINDAKDKKKTKKKEQDDLPNQHYLALLDFNDFVSSTR